MRNKILILMTIACLGSCSTNKPVVPNYYSTNEINYTDRVNNLLDQMTLEEKIGQLNLVDAGDITTGESRKLDFYELIRDGSAGGVFNLKSPEGIAKAQQIAIEETRLHIPLLVGMDVIHGYKTIFPIPLGLSSTWDMDMIQQTARVAAIEASASGINWTFSPMVDISRDPRWGRIAEGSGEDAYLGSQIAKAMVYGYQKNDLSSSDTILSCVKHFALYGAVEAGRDYNTVDMSRVRMFNEYLPPYKAAIDAGAGSIMPSFNDINGVPATSNKWLLTDLLRDQCGFEGLVVTDYTAIPEMINHGVADNLQDASAQAINAGTDMDMVGAGFYKTLEDSVDDDKVSIKTIDQAVKRILLAKFELGLFDTPYEYGNNQKAKTDVFSQEHRNFARKVASDSMVLLKNKENLLPLKNQV